MRSKHWLRRNSAAVRACVAPCSVRGGSNLRFAGVWAFQAALWLVSSTLSPWRTMKGVGFCATCAAILIEEFLRYLTPSPGRLAAGSCAFPAANEAFATGHRWCRGSEGSQHNFFGGSQKSLFAEGCLRSAFGCRSLGWL